MKKNILLTSVVLFSPSISTLAQAAQCAINDCAYLGYTETQNTGNCLKCPFGDYWSCPETNSQGCDSTYAYPCNKYAQEPDSYGCNGKYRKCSCGIDRNWDQEKDSCGCDDTFKYTCTGEHQQPSGYECDGKYSQCYCDTSYTWHYGECTQGGYLDYYIDKTECFKANDGIIAYGIASKQRCTICPSKEATSNQKFTLKQFDSGNDEQDMRDCINYVDTQIGGGTWYSNYQPGYMYNCYYNSSCQ